MSYGKGMNKRNTAKATAYVAKDDPAIIAYVATQYRTKNDINGNARRVWVIRAVPKSTACTTVECVYLDRCGTNVVAQMPEVIAQKLSVDVNSAIEITPREFAFWKAYPRQVGR